MINDAQVFLAGYVASEPRFRTIAGGTPTAQIRVAYTPRRIDRETGEWSDAQTTFVNVVCWRTLARNVALCLRKGEPVVVRGRLQIRRYEDKQGMARFVTEIDASSLGHDLARGVAHFQRTRRSAGETAAESGAGPGAESPAGGPAALNGGGELTDGELTDGELTGGELTGGELTGPAADGEFGRGEFFDESAVTALAEPGDAGSAEVAAPF